MKCGRRAYASSSVQAGPSKVFLHLQRKSSRLEPCLANGSGRHDLDLVVGP
jgi:hypothetical protein